MVSHVAGGIVGRGRHIALAVMAVAVALAITLAVLLSNSHRQFTMFSNGSSHFTEGKAYLYVVRTDHLNTIGLSNQALLDLAHKICAAQDSGQDDEAQYQIAINAGFPQMDAASLTGAAVGAFCAPQ